MEWIHVVPSHRPDPTLRENAISREISLCSEYTRFTVEGRMRDPESDKAVILDRVSMGPLFLAGPFRNPRWSKKLGYGMATINEDTRVHMHLNGKYIVRRAMNEEHALSSFLVLSEIAKPAIYSASTATFLWEDIRELALGVGDPVRKRIENTLSWPGQMEDTEQIIDNAVEGFNNAKERFGPIMDRIEDNNDPISISDIEDDKGSIFEPFTNGLMSILQGVPSETGHLTGWGCFISLVSNVMVSKDVSGK